MSFEKEGEDKTDRRPKADPRPQADREDLARGPKKRGPNAEIGQALRKAYSDAVDETIPPEMLDLLGRLD